MRTARTALLFFAILVIGAAAPASAGVPKVVFDEEFGFAL